MISVNPNPSPASVLSELSTKFSSYAAAGAGGPGKPYPKELKALVGEACASGFSVAEIAHACGRPKAQIKDWLKAAATPKLRRLRIVDSGCAPAAVSPVSVRFPSGATLEADATLLLTPALKALLFARSEV